MALPSGLSVKGNCLSCVFSDALAGLIQISQTRLRPGVSRECGLMKQLRSLFMVANLLAKQAQVVVIRCAIGERAVAVWIARIFRPQGTQIRGCVVDQRIVDGGFLMEQILS